MQQSGFKLIIMFQIYLVISNAPALIQYCQLFANAGKCILVLLAKTVNRRKKHNYLLLNITSKIKLTSPNINSVNCCQSCV